MHVRNFGIFQYISEFWEFIHYSASNLEYTHTQTQCFVFYRIIVFAWTLLCTSIWQHNREVHIQYNSKLGLHAQHRCTVIPASLCQVQDAWTLSSHTTSIGAWSPCNSQYCKPIASNPVYSLVCEGSYNSALTVLTMATSSVLELHHSDV